MDVNRIALWVLVVFTVLTLSLILGTGMVAVFPRRWNRTLYEAGVEEVYRRFDGLGRRSQADHISASRLIGNEPVEPDEAGEEDGILDIILVFTSLTDRRAVSDELSIIRGQLEASAVQQQLRLVARIRSIRIASFVWVGAKFVYRAQFAAYGFIWFFPQTLPYLGRRLQKYAVASAIGGVVLGILLAGVSQALASEEDSVRWLSIVSDVVTLSTVLGLVLAMLGLYKEFFESRFGPLNEWTVRGTLSGVSLAILLGMTLFLSLSGQFSRWQAELAEVAQRVDVGAESAPWGGAIVVLLVVAYLLRNAYLWIRQASVSWQDRFGTAAVALMLLLMLALVGIMVLNVPVDTDPIILVGGLAAAGMGLLSAAAGIVSWVSKFRVLKRMSWVVARRGFRVWALAVWLITGFIAPLSGLWVDVWARQILVEPLWGHAATMFFGILYGLWVVATFPGLVITGLYVRRVSRAYDDFLFSLAPKHPKRSGPT